MKNPFKNLSPRTIRILFSVAAAFALSVGTLNFLQVMVYNVTSNDQCAWRTIPGEPSKLLITDIVPGGVTDHAGIHNGDTLLQVNGGKFETAQQAQVIINAIPTGEYATYRISRNGTGEQVDLQVKILKVFNVTFLTLFCLGLGFLIVGYVVVMTKPEGALQRRFGRYSLVAMLVFSFFSGPLQVPGNPFLSGLFLFSVVLGRLFGCPMFVNFFFHFPVKRPSLHRRWITIALYTVSVGLIALTTIGANQQWPQAILFPLFYSPLNFYVAGFVVFVHSYFKFVEPHRRSQLRPILIGIALGATATVYIFAVTFTNPFALFLYPSLFVPGLLLIAVPIGFGYSIFRYRLMDIDLLVKRSLIYATITASMAAIYLLMVYGIGNLIAYFLGTEENRLLNIVAFIFIALLFDPIKRRSQAWIDRVFYQDRYNYQRALLEFSQELPRQMNLEQILTSMLNRISSTMHVEKIAVVLCDDTEGCFSVAQNIEKRDATFAISADGLMALLRRTRAPQSLAFLEDEPQSKEINAEDKLKITQSGVVLAVPMYLQDRLIGSINVGPKLSGRFYSQEDIDLLSTVASQAAIAIENARLHKSEIEKQKIEEELSLARKIQQGLLPKSDPVIEGLDISGVSVPALSVGGDYYDYIELSPKKLLVVVADVSGKGMSAALYMSKIQGMIQLAANMYNSPKEMLVHVNRRLYDGIERKSFITMILALFDLEKNEIRICRAGHNKAIVGVNGSLEYLNSKGIGLGLERGPIFESSLEEVCYPLKKDQILLLYSDGLTEAMNDQQQQFGEDAICGLIKSNREHSARDIQNALLDSVNRFRGSADQHDDITIVVAKHS